MTANISREKAEGRRLARRLEQRIASSRPEPRPVDVQTSHAAPERVRVDFEQLGGAAPPFHSALGEAEGSLYVSPHGLLERRWPDLGLTHRPVSSPAAGGRRLAATHQRRAEVKRRSGAEKRCTVDDRLQLTDVARPVVGSEERDVLGSRGERPEPEPPRRPKREMLRARRSAYDADFATLEAEVTEVVEALCSRIS